MSLDNFKYNLQRLKKCDQYWDEMSPISGGRHCAKCNKIITDFSGMTFAEIALFMSSSDKPVCGFYLPEQLKAIKGKHFKAPLVLGLSTLVATTTLADNVDLPGYQVQQNDKKVNNQPISIKEIHDSKTVHDTITISGRVVYLDSASNSNKPIPFASIIVKGTGYGITANQDGYFKLQYPATDSIMIIAISSIDFRNMELAIKTPGDKKEIDIGVIEMRKWEGVITEFYVNVKSRTALGRFWRKITKPFRK